jgi:hypothetical protein
MIDQGVNRGVVFNKIKNKCNKKCQKIKEKNNEKVKKIGRNFWTKMRTSRNNRCLGGYSNVGRLEKI